MKELSAKNVIETLREAGVPCCPVNSVKEVMEEPHVIERGCLADHDHPAYGHIKFIKNPISRDGQFPEVRFPSPGMGQQTKEILAQVGYSKEKIEELISSGAAVAGKE